MFYPTATDGTYVDDNGELWPLSPKLVTELKNSGSLADFPAASGGGGVGSRDFTALGIPSTGQPPARGQLQGLPLDAGGAGTPPMAPPTAAPKMTAIPQKPNPTPGYSLLKGLPQDVGGAPPQQTPQPNLQRVMPGQRGQQQGAPEQQRYFKRVAPTEGKWVDTARQSSGWSEEQQADMRDRLTEERDATYRAKMAEIGAYEATQNDAKMRAERSYIENANKAIEEQRKLDTQNLYIENQQKKVGERIKAARERQVDPTKPFQGAAGGLAGVLAVFGAGLGQYGAGINGGPNNALSLFNNMIDRSVSEQLRLIEEEKDGALMSKAELDDFQFKNSEEKKAYIRSIELAKQAADIDSITADDSLKMIHPMALQAKAAADERLNQDLMTVNSAISRTAGQQYVQPRAGGVYDDTERVLAGQARESGYRKTIRENEEAASGGTIGEALIVSPEGNVIGKAPNAARAEKLNERQSAFNEAERLGTQLLDINLQQQESGGMFRSEEDKARYRSIATRYKNALWSAVRSDAPSSTESEAFEEAMGGLDLANYQAGKQRSVLQQTLEDGRANLADRIQQQGGDPSYLRRRKPNAKNEGFTP
jgi:hypothetical protein